MGADETAGEGRQPVRLAAAGRGAVWWSCRGVARGAPLGAARRRSPPFPRSRPCRGAGPDAPARRLRASHTQSEAAGVPSGAGIRVRRREARRTRPGDPQAAGRNRARRGERCAQTLEEGNAGCCQAPRRPDGAAVARSGRLAGKARMGCGARCVRAHPGALAAGSGRRPKSREARSRGRRWPVVGHRSTWKFR